MLLQRQAREELAEHTAAVQLVVLLRGNEPTLRQRVQDMLAEPGYPRQMHVVVTGSRAPLEVGPRPTGATWTRTVSTRGVTVRGELPRSAVWTRVAQLALLVLALSVVAFLAA